MIHVKDTPCRHYGKKNCRVVGAEALRPAADRGGWAQPNGQKLRFKF